MLSVSDCDSLHRVPLLLLHQQIISLVSQRLNLSQLTTSQSDEATDIPENKDPEIREDANKLLFSNYSYEELVGSSRYFARWNNLALREESPLPEVCYKISNLEINLLR